jgi:ribosome-interacting GTPase 1
LVQLVEIPGLIDGANSDRGGGRALLGVLRSADAIVYCARASADPAELAVVRAEISIAGIQKPSILALTRVDEASDDEIRRHAIVDDIPVLRVSVLDDDSLDALRTAIWRLTGLIRVRLRRGDEVDPDPVALPPGSTVTDVADGVHHDLGRTFVGARVWGPSARFEGQRVGRDHLVLDGDAVEILGEVGRA